MSVQTEVVYPSVSSFSSSAQLNIGPYFVPSVNKLLRVEAHGQINFQGVVLGSSSVFANFQLWAVQWVPHTAAPADCITTADGPNWLVRQQVGSEDLTTSWAPSTNNAAVLVTAGIVGSWAGQLPIGGDIDLWLSAKAPTGVVIPNMNLFASLRFWWS
jgi:hypothetical protein